MRARALPRGARRQRRPRRALAPAARRASTLPRPPTPRTDTVALWPRVVTWAALAVLAGVGIWWLRFLWGALHSEAGRYDFSTYYAAALALRHNLHANIYDAATLARAGSAAHVLVRPPLPYTYPPPLALLLAPFTVLPFRLLSRLWLLGNAALWLAVVGLLAREIYLPLAEPLRRWLGAATPAPTSAVGARGRTSIADHVARMLAAPAPLVALSVAAVLVLPAAPATQTLLTGQVDLLVLLPLALVPELTRRGHERTAGVMITLAGLLKLTPLLLLGALALRRRWRALGAALVTLAALTLACALLLGPGALLASLAVALRTGSADSALGQNEALLASLLPHGARWAPLVADALRLIIAAALAWLLWNLPPSRAREGRVGVRVNGRRRNAGQAPAAVTPAPSPRAWGEGWGERSGEVSAYAVALCALLLLSPVAWVHHYVWALPAAAIALGWAGADWLRAPSRRAALALAIVILACAALCWPLPYAWDTQSQPAVTTLLGLPLRPLALELRALGTLALLATAGYRMLASSRPAHDHAESSAESPRPPTPARSPV